MIRSTMLLGFCNENEEFFVENVIFVSLFATEYLAYVFSKEFNQFETPNKRPE